MVKDVGQVNPTDKLVPVKPGKCSIKSSVVLLFMLILPMSCCFWYANSTPLLLFMPDVLCFGPGH